MSELWENNEIQFARLISEIQAALDESQTHELMKDLMNSMDLSLEDLDSLFCRAEAVWEAAKKEEKNAELVK